MTLIINKISIYPPPGGGLLMKVFCIQCSGWCGPELQVFRSSLESVSLCKVVLQAWALSPHVSINISVT